MQSPDGCLGAALPGRMLHWLHSELHSIPEMLASAAQVDALRRFYTSLKEQRPGSEMATRWCAQHGLLPREEAEAWVVEQAQVGGLGRVGG